MTELKESGLEFSRNRDGFSVYFYGRNLMNHSDQSPLIYLGRGLEDVEMYRGNFNMEDYVIERLPLFIKTIDYKKDNKIEISWTTYPSDSVSVLVTELEEHNNCLYIDFNQIDQNYNRSWIRINAYDKEKIYGCGEQLSYFNLRGNNFPLWTSEPGVGRNKSTYTTFQADVKDKAGGDYYTTNFPQPTFLSTEKYFCHVDTTAYADFNFENERFHELHFWAIPNNIVFSVADSYKTLQRNIADLLGKQPELPDWSYEGIWLGIQGGTHVVEEKIKEAERIGLKVAAVWLQDWQGRKTTSFGKRLKWNWQWDQKHYPELDKKIVEWNKQGIKTLGYLNPYLLNEAELFNEAQELGLLAKNEEGTDYLVDFGEFDCGVVDFTNPKAVEWYKKVIKENAIDMGLSGWMADFGEYLPTDVVLYDGSSAMLKHNEWPNLWAEINKKAVEESGKSGEVVYFMRAGYTGVQTNCTLLWAGDQSVNWSIDDGLASVIPAALSAGVSGMGLHHSDIGGYTSLHGNKRSKELLMRWAEMAAFTPVMRTHEGNRPEDCFQYDDDEESLLHIKKMTDIYTSLAPYMKKYVKENAESGLPVQRPLFYEYENDEGSFDIQYEYMLGEDLLIAPVFKPEVESWEVYLPEDEWVHLWSGEKYKGGTVSVKAPIGEPPVFYRASSKHSQLFNNMI